MNVNKERASENLIYFDSSGVEYIPKKSKYYRKQKYSNNYLYNKSIRFDNVKILLYWIY